MKASVYTVEARVSDMHWWFAGRRRLLSRLIRALHPNPSWCVLEVGAGTGANLPVLHAIGAGRVLASVGGMAYAADAMLWACSITWDSNVPTCRPAPRSTTRSSPRSAERD